MKILALEFSTSRRSVALFDSTKGAVAAAVAETGGRSTRAFALISQALKDAGWQREHVEAIAVGIGPGSYTGIRAALSIAQGWYLARHVQTAGVSSVAAMALQEQKTGHRGLSNFVIDAQRNEFYVAQYEISAAARREITPLKIVAAEEIRARINAGKRVCGPDISDALPQSISLFPEAAAVAELAAAHNAFTAPQLIEPIYLRETTFVKAGAPRIIS